ncbi:ABC-2 type transport system permease protein [Salipaludibacillus aurantiacus]|uniref:ABC-2 type transport system permease protein n=2 Tax=Salipaludibacillus aurantiacus TaxID=1601833 RepID=A0A1H9WI68_9BACI|nr:ABC-2 type transport system permease protein [Salipaludibacillus aurantiacus]
MMKQWGVLFKKEWTESVRNFKWLWLPVVFILLGVMQPLTSYYFADIIENFGGLPEGAVLDIPPPSGAEVLAGTLGQFSQIGFLVLVLAFMGTVAGEKSHGTHLMVLVKPVSYFNYLTAKWVHILLISLSSFVVGFAGAVYYTALLIETVPVNNVLSGGAVYALWITFIMTLVLCLSALFRSTAIVAFGSLGTALLMSVLSMYTPDLMKWSPGMLSSHSQMLFYSGDTGDGFWVSLAMTIVLITGIMTLTIYMFNKKEVAGHTE